MFNVRLTTSALTWTPPGVITLSHQPTRATQTLGGIVIAKWLKKSLNLTDLKLTDRITIALFSPLDPSSLSLSWTKCRVSINHGKVYAGQNHAPPLRIHKSLLMAVLSLHKLTSLMSCMISSSKRIFHQQSIGTS